MPCDSNSDLFRDPEDQAAYEAFCRSQPRGGEPFALGEPVLVCRWRLVDARVPLLNRHLRALAARRIAGRPLPAALIAWVKQHVEWSLAASVRADPAAEADGVLMLVIDAKGAAALSVGAHVPLADRSPRGLAARADMARCEARRTGVAPETACRVEDGALRVGMGDRQTACGLLSLVEQLAATRGHEVLRDPALASDRADETVSDRAIRLLVSDEHGVVVARTASAPQSTPADVALVSLLEDACARLGVLR